MGLRGNTHAQLKYYANVVLGILHASPNDEKNTVHGRLPCSHTQGSPSPEGGRPFFKGRLGKHSGGLLVWSGND